MLIITPPSVKVIHTAGAGDAFTAGFLAGIIKKYKFENTLCLGQVNSTSVVQHIGTKNKLLNEKEAQAMIKKFRMKVGVKNVS
jgi:sugar/nucleoside kinase (ribokinase family)